eukprot:gnl/TRDRNA2_/TRDRNA2_184280_c0_seq1.p1 gnl/TRDRNA2_/TRDRNA2_184280_c0~~gnl/TRDRNA2_/TRDRNA2_184280_c0_seq1.p1  ORF type:complete len:315 (+),score=47.95 gnl/TRDRNA2_/TRDRNA2_184280_c0_seq1:73-1017(+)
MYRAIPVISKSCAARQRKRDDERAAKRLRDIKPTVDTTAPATFCMDHVRINPKHEMNMEQRYLDIDLENRRMLTKMAEVMLKDPKPVLNRSRSQPAPGPKDGRKAELLRITKDNRKLAHSIATCKPVYSRVEMELGYQKSVVHMKKLCQQPVVLKTSGSLVLGKSQWKIKDESASEMRSYPEYERSYPEYEQDKPSTDFQATGGSGDDGMRNVLKEGKRMGDVYYLLEMSTNGRTLQISAYDGESQRNLELLLNEVNHRKIWRDAMGDYSRIAQQLRVDGNPANPDTMRLVLDPIADAFIGPAYGNPNSSAGAG